MDHFESTMGHCSYIKANVLPHCTDIHLNQKETLFLFSHLHEHFVAVKTFQSTFEDVRADITSLCGNITKIIAHVRSCNAPNDSIFAIILQEAMEAIYSKINENLFLTTDKQKIDNSHLVPYVESNLIQPVSILEENLLKQVRHFIHKTPCIETLKDLITICPIIDIDVLTTNNQQSAVHLFGLDHSDDPLILSRCLKNVPNNKLQKLINLQRKIDGNTALHLASKNGKVNIVNCLLEHGATTSWKNFLSQTAMDVAANDDIANLIKKSEFFDLSVGANSEFFTTLLEESNLNKAETSFFDYFDALDHAIDMSDMSLARVSFKKSTFSLVEKNKFEEPFLIKAVGLGNVEIVRLLLQKGADPLALHHGMNALHYAVKKGDVQFVKIFLKNVKDVNVPSEDLGQTALHLAAENGHFPLVKLLLAHGANFEAQNKFSQTPFQVSINRNVSKLLNAIGDLHKMATRHVISETSLSKIFFKVKSSQDYNVFLKATNAEGKTVVQLMTENKGPVYSWFKKLFLCKAKQPAVS